mmetsp:Transcript_23895/g.48768  ORF Transcript_23895/g.48768 Transcript_23895/m.48768 type:complete len:134 (-) Transcript_23895:1714-2115(-)
MTKQSTRLFVHNVNPCLSILYSRHPPDIVPIISIISAKMNRSKKKNDDDHNTKPAAGGTEAITEENNEEDSRNQGKNEGDDTNSTKGLASYAYRDFSKAPNDRGYLDAIQSRVRPPSKKLPTKLNAMLIDPGE